MPPDVGLRSRRFQLRLLAATAAGAPAASAGLQVGECVNDYSDYGARNCDAAWGDFRFSCSVLEQAYAWDCEGCACPGDLQVTTTVVDAGATTTGSLTVLEAGRSCLSHGLEAVTSREQCFEYARGVMGIDNTVAIDFSMGVYGCMHFADAEQTAVVFSLSGEEGWENPDYRSICVGASTPATSLTSAATPTTTTTPKPTTSATALPTFTTTASTSTRTVSWATLTATVTETLSRAEHGARYTLLPESQSCASRGLQALLDRQSCFEYGAGELGLGSSQLRAIDIDLGVFGCMYHSGTILFSLQGESGRENPIYRSICVNTIFSSGTTSSQTSVETAASAADATSPATAASTTSSAASSAAPSAPGQVATTSATAAPTASPATAPESTAALVSTTAASSLLAEAPTTTLSQPVLAGASTLDVVSQEGFRAGGRVVISGGGNSETRTIAGLGSIVLAEPLETTYPAGSTVTGVVEGPGTPAGLPAEASAAAPRTSPPPELSSGEGPSSASSLLVATVLIGGLLLVPVGLLGYRHRWRRRSSEVCQFDAIVPSKLASAPAQDAGSCGGREAGGPAQHLVFDCWQEHPAESRAKSGLVSPLPSGLAQPAVQLDAQPTESQQPGPDRSPESVPAARSSGPVLGRSLESAELGASEPSRPRGQERDFDRWVGPLDEQPARPRSQRPGLDRTPDGSLGAQRAEPQSEEPGLGHSPESVFGARASGPQGQGPGLDCSPAGPFDEQPTRWQSQDPRLVRLMPGGLAHPASLPDAQPVRPQALEPGADRSPASLRVRGAALAADELSSSAPLPRFGLHLDTEPQT